MENQSLLVRFRRIDCPNSRTISSPIIPAIINLTPNARKGGENSTTIFADVNALDQISENKIPRPIECLSIGEFTIYFLLGQENKKP